MSKDLDIIINSLVDSNKFSSLHQWKLLKLVAFPCLIISLYSTYIIGNSHSIIPLLKPILINFFSENYIDSPAFQNPFYYFLEYFSFILLSLIWLPKWIKFTQDPSQKIKFFEIPRWPITHYLYWFFGGLLLNFSGLTILLSLYFDSLYPIIVTLLSVYFIMRFLFLYPALSLYNDVDLKKMLASTKDFNWVLFITAITGIVLLYLVYIIWGAFFAWTNSKKATFISDILDHSWFLAFFELLFQLIHFYMIATWFGMVTRIYNHYKSVPEKSVNTLDNFEKNSLS